MQVIPSDGTRIITYDRPTSMCPSTFCELRHKDGKISVTTNGRKKSRDTDYQAGIEVDTDGSYALVVWMPLSTRDTVSFEFSME